MKIYNINIIIIDDWNHYSNPSCEWLTNNVSESGNARLKKKHPSPNPGFYKLVIVIQHEISNSLMKLDQVFAGLLTLRHSKEAKVNLYMISSFLSIYHFLGHQVYN